MRVRVRSPKKRGACASACETFFEVRVCVRRTLKYLATQRLKIIQLEKGKYFNLKKENIPIREMKIFQLGNGKYFQSELVN